MKSKLRILVGVLLLIGGGICFLFPNIQEWYKQRSVDQIIERFEESYAAQTETERAKETEKLTEDAVKTDGIKTESSEAVNSETDDSDTNVQQTEIVESENPETESKETESQTEKKEIFTELYSEMEAYNEDLFLYGQEIVDAWSYEQTPLDLSLLNSSEPVIGYIEIPDMKVRLPLFLGASPENLGKGAAVLSETSMPIGGENTNCVIAGHRGWNGMAYFQRIENLVEGSKVYITNPWETLVYEVSGVKIIGPNDVSSILIQPGEDMITLFTCHPYVIGGGAYRYLAFCKRAGTQERSASKEVNNPKADPAPETSAEVIQLDTETIEQPAVPETEKARTAEMRETSNDFLLKLEEKLRTWLPIGTVCFAAVIVVLRFTSCKREECISKKKTDKQKRKKERKKKDFDKI